MMPQSRKRKAGGTPSMPFEMDGEASPKIDIDMRLATQALLDESRKGPKGKNVVCSPLSLEFMLHMVAAGSRGQTFSQILQLIAFRDSTLSSMEALNLKSCAIMRVASSLIEPQVLIANGVWVNQKYKLKPSYRVLMNDIYNARAEAVDFGNPQVIKDINSWVADKTKGLIKEILGFLDRTTVLILVNALYFKGLWNENTKFNKDMTEDRDFHLLDGSKVLVPFMTRYSPSGLYRAFDDFKVLQLNYESGNDGLRNFCMQILLPNERDGLQKLVDKCISDPGFLDQDFGLKHEKLNRLWIPKFKFTYKVENISGMMQGLGLTAPFMRNCQDLTEMVQLEPLENIYISEIVHKATIEVDEDGAKAAAVTYVCMSPGFATPFFFPPPPVAEFVAEHPFFFVIKEAKTSAIFFIGVVFNPLQED